MTLPHLLFWYMTSCQSELLITAWVFFLSLWKRDWGGNHSLKASLFFPNCFRITEGERKKEKGQTKLWRPLDVTRFWFPVHVWKPASHFVPLGQSDRLKKTERWLQKDCCLRGNAFQIQADRAFAFPHLLQLALLCLSHPWTKGGTHRPIKRCVSPIANG